ncbi:MAG: cytochrome c oxidase subunit II [Lysobacterales bacterium]|jgi:cytochrome c oxidase subunit 2
MKKENTVIVALAVLAAIMAAFWLLLVAPSMSGNEVNMTRGVTPQSAEHFDLHMIILWICVAIGIVVFTVMFTSIVLHRKSRGVEAAKFSHSTKAEIIWTVIPVLILVAMAVPATTALVRMEDTSGTEMTVKITGFQWRWKYEYLDEGISFISSLDPDSNAARQLGSGVNPEDVENYLLEVDNPLVLPVGRKIEFLITADDVIHSWWVPDFGWKRDAIPGFVNQAWTLIEEPGVYRGQCAELCGKDHGFMPIVVNAVSEQEYEAWVQTQLSSSEAQQQDMQRLWTRAELMEHGQAVYEKVCATCHQPNGSGLPPAFPALAGSAVATGPVSENIDVVMNGRAGTAMAAWRSVLSEADIAATLTYTRNAFGNDTGDVVQPVTIAGMNGEPQGTSL